MVPMGHPGHDYAINIGQNLVHCFAFERGHVRQFAGDVARLNIGENWKVVDVRKETCNPINQLMTILPKLFGRHITEIIRRGLSWRDFVHSLCWLVTKFRMTTPATVSRSKTVATRNASACAPMLLTVRAASSSTINFELTKCSLILASVIRSAGPAISTDQVSGMTDPFTLAGITELAST